MRKVLGLAVVAMVVAATACNNSSTDTTSSAAGYDASAAGQATTPTRDSAELSKNVPSNQPGVTPTEIRVTSIGSITNALGADYTQAPKGTQAYFDMINAQGGIYGRKLVLVESKDDQMTKNKEQAQQVVSQANVFAVLPVTTILFTGADELADAGIPTYGWNINPEWSGPENFFGEKGSYICIECGSPASVYAAKKLGAESVGVLAFGVDQSRQCATGVKNAFEKGQGPPITFTDDTVSYGTTDYSVQVQKMKDANVDYAVLCVDLAAAVNLGRELQKQGIKVPLYLNNGYEQDTVTNFGDVLEGSIVGTAMAPQETTPAPPGLQRYNEWIAKVPEAEAGEQTLTGWLNADLFYQGLVAAGPEFTQQSVIDATNQITNWTADGLVPHIDWTKAHTQQQQPVCYAMSEIKGGRFVPFAAEPGKPFACLPTDAPVPDQADMRA